MAQLIQFLSNQQETQLVEIVEGRISQLIDYLRSSRCFLVLDNFETVLQIGEYTGYYREGYEGYSELLRRVGETHHQSCLLLTSREKPAGVALLEAEDLPIRLLQLTGLQEPEAQKIIKAKNLIGTEEERRKLMNCYRGNPLALKIASTSIQYLFESNIYKFLRQSTTVFNSIAVVLEQQFSTVKLWDVREGKCLKTLQAHGSQVLLTLFSTDGGTLFSSSADNSIKFWDVLTRECLRIQEHSNWAWSVTLSPDEMLASGSQDETIKFWQVKTGKCLKKLRVPRPYEGMNITHVTGLTQATMGTLIALGAVEV